MEAVPKKNQIWALAVTGFFVLISVLTYAHNEYYIYLSAYLWFGFIYGMCLQYGRFCFASAFRDLFAVGVPRMVVGIMIATILFGLVSAFVTITGMSTFHAAPTGLHATIAGLIFGVGMVFAGGCASGSLYKTGEGNGVAFLVIVSISITQAIFVDIGGWFNKLVPASWTKSALSKGVPEVVNVADGWLDQYLAGYVWDRSVLKFSGMLGLKDTSVAGAFFGDFFVGIIVPAAFLLLIVYVIWARKSYMRKISQGKASGTTLKDEFAGYWGMIMSSKRTAIAGLFLGIAC